MKKSHKFRVVNLIGVVFLILFSVFSRADTKITLEGKDTPNDKGASIDISWNIEDQSIIEKSLNIFVFRKTTADTKFLEIKRLDISNNKYTDKNDVIDKTPYFYKLVFKDENEKTIFETNQFGPFVSKPQWFNSTKIFTLVFSFISMFIILVFIQIAKTGRKLYIRPLPGVKAIEEAVGRATEMGKPCIFVPGISTITDIATLASISILSKVSETIAEYNSRMIIPNFDPIVYSVVDEVVKNSYLKMGRPDAYRADDVYYLTSRQFAYASGVAGLMAREKPAANFFLGWFMAESLILAESGAMTGAIQIAGTDSVSQIPFFIVACDYTLIGEELYAAGAYMGDDKSLLGGLKGQDYVKLVVMIALLICFLLKLFGVEGMDTFLTGGAN